MRLAYLCILVVAALLFLFLILAYHFKTRRFAKAGGAWWQTPGGRMEMSLDFIIFLIISATGTASIYSYLSGALIPGALRIVLIIIFSAILVVPIWRIRVLFKGHGNGNS